MLFGLRALLRFIFRTIQRLANSNGPNFVNSNTRLSHRIQHTLAYLDLLISSILDLCNYKSYHLQFYVILVSPLISDIYLTSALFSHCNLLGIFFISLCILNRRGTLCKNIPLLISGGDYSVKVFFSAFFIVLIRTLEKSPNEGRIKSSFNSKISVDITFIITWGNTGKNITLSL